MADPDDRGANDPENPPSTKGWRGNARDATTHEDQVDHRNYTETGFVNPFEPSLVDEEKDPNSSVDDGYNSTTKPSPKGQTVKSDRFRL